MVGELIGKVCPIVLRGPIEARQVLVFRHPLAGVQLVKGTLEPGETIVAGALRELAEESGIMDSLGAAPCGSSESIDAGQLWYFVAVATAELPDRWTFDTQDDGGHRFAFFWWPLDQAANGDWHPVSVRALAFVADIATGLD